MPRGAPRKPFGLRLDPVLIEEVRSLSSNLTKAVEDALKAWLTNNRKPKKPLIPNDGREAARAGFKLDDNPFRQHTPAHSMWRDDWLDTNGRRQ
jgi:hypothetical protein